MGDDQGQGDDVEESAAAFMNPRYPCYCGDDQGLVDDVPEAARTMNRWSWLRRFRELREILRAGRIDGAFVELGLHPAGFQGDEEPLVIVDKTQLRDPGWLNFSRTVRRLLNRRDA